METWTASGDWRSGDYGAQIVELLDPVARAISASGAIRYPNPMGLPPLT